eukprot:1188471-Prorocentrum_minimum.AAC.1
MVQLFPGLQQYAQAGVRADHRRLAHPGHGRHPGRASRPECEGDLLRHLGAGETQSQEGRQYIPIVRTNHRRGGSMFPA